MEKKNYDIWAIEHYPKEVYDAIDGLEKTTNNTLFTNCRSHLRVERTILPIQFDSALISEDIQRLVLVMQNGPLGKKEFQRILQKKHIPFDKVHFMWTQPEEQQELKEVWFAADIGVLQDGLKDSREKGVDSCEYYPDMKGTFELRYPLEGEDDENPDWFVLEEQGIRGVVLLEDKLVMLMDNNH